VRALGVVALAPVLDHDLRLGQPLHSSDFDFNDALLPVGVALWRALVCDRLAQRG